MRCWALRKCTLFANPFPTSPTAFNTSERKSQLLLYVKSNVFVWLFIICVFYTWAILVFMRVILFTWLLILFCRRNYCSGAGTCFCAFKIFLAPSFVDVLSQVCFCLILPPLHHYYVLDYFSSCMVIFFFPMFGWLDVPHALCC